MSNLAQFMGGARPPSSIINEFAAGSVSTTGAPLAAAPGKQILSGSLSAATLSTVLSITGAGILMWAALRTMDATSRTVRAKVTIDGVVVFDATSNAIAQSGDGIVIVGGILQASGNTPAEYAQVAFNVSLLIQIASSLTETDKIALKTAYQVY